MEDKNTLDSSGGGSMQISLTSLDTLKKCFFAKRKIHTFLMLVLFHTHKENLHGFTDCSFIHSLHNYIYPSLSLSLSAHMIPSMQPMSILELSLPINPCKCTSWVFMSIQTQHPTCSNLESPSLTVSLRSLTGPHLHPDRNFSLSSNHFKVCL